MQTTIPTYMQDEATRFSPIELSQIEYRARKSAYDSGACEESELRTAVWREMREAIWWLKYGPLTSWLYQGLVTLAEDGLAVPPQRFDQTNRRALTDDLRAKVEDEILDAVETDQPYTDEQIAVTRAWLSQTPYAIFVRCRHYEEALQAEVSDYSLSFLECDAPNLEAFAAETWQKIVRAFRDDVVANRQDRLIRAEKI